MEAVVRNTFVQGVLSILFVTLAIIVIITAVIASVRSYRSGGAPSAEDPAVPSRTFAPAGFLATPRRRNSRRSGTRCRRTESRHRTGH